MELILRLAALIISSLNVKANPNYIYLTADLIPTRINFDNRGEKGVKLR